MTRNFSATILVASLFLGGLACGAFGQTAAAPDVSTQPATAPVAPAAAPPPPGATSAPATQPADPAVMKILDALEQAGAKYSTIQADIDYNVVARQTGDTEDRTGYVAYQKESDKGPAKFRVHFDTVSLGGGPKIKKPRDYAFDGQWLTDANSETKTLTRYQLAAPGEKVDALKLGKGPFPMPFGQNAADMLKYFQIATRAPKEGDPKDSDYLLLTPRRLASGEEMNFVKLEMWVSRDSHLPVKIISADKSKNVTTVVFKNIQPNKKFGDEMFLIPRPAGWQESKKRFEDQEPK